MIGYSSAELFRALGGIGLKRGDVILLSTDLLRLGRMMDVGSSQECLETVLETIFRVISEEGTLVVHSYTTQVGRYGVPFVYEETECVNGTFCQYVLSHRDSIRSLHPIHSFASLGKLKREICENASSSNFGLDSPLDRILKRNGQIVTLGMDYFRSAYVHYVEMMYGVPYVYNKLLDVDVYVNGQRIDKRFSASVRYLEYPFSFDWNKVKKAIDARQCVSSEALGAFSVSRIAASNYCDVLLALLKEDVYALLKEPPRFVKGKVPFDGVTKNRDGVTGRGNYQSRVARYDWMKLRAD